MRGVVTNDNLARENCTCQDPSGTVGRGHQVGLQIQKQFHMYCHTAWRPAPSSTSICLVLTAFSHTSCQWFRRLGGAICTMQSYYISSTLKLRTSAPLSILLLTTYLIFRLSQGYAPTFPDSSPYSNRSVSRLNTWQPPVLRPCINSHQPRPCFSQQCRNSLPISSDMHEQNHDLSDLDLACIRPHSRSLADPSS